MSSNPDFPEKMDRQFEALLVDYKLDELRSYVGTIYGVWADYRLAYMNPGWFRFAKENGGEPAISRDWELGRSILDAMADDVRDIYQTKYDQCLRFREAWKNEYECSSALVYRWFHQTVYPLGRGGEGLLFVNALAVERPHNARLRPDLALDEAAYVGPGGVLQQCCHCRKMKNFRESERWDWVRDWVKRSPANTSHTFCPSCYGYYYSLLRE